MKSEIIEAAPVPEKSKYPYLGIECKTKLIVLFFNEREGVAVKENKYWPIGEYSDSWAESEFSPFTGTVKLSND